MSIPISNTTVTLLKPVETEAQEDYDPHNREAVATGVRAAINPGGGSRTTSAEGTIQSSTYVAAIDPVTGITSDTVVKDEHNGNLYSIEAHYEVRFPLHYWYIGLELLND